MKVARLADSHNADAQRLRQQYVGALTQFIAKLSLSADALERVKLCLANARSSPVEALLEQLATELEAREQGSPAAALRACEDTAPAPEAPADTAAVENVLLTLFDRVVLSPGSERDAKRHKETLLQGISAEELPRFVNELAELISQSLLLTQREKQELEAFVETLLEKLRAFALFVENVQSDIREARSNQEDFQESWDVHAQTLENGVAQATSLEVLKADVNAQLEQMRTSMTEFREKETERIRRSEDRSETLQGKLEQMETETAELRNQLAENRAKLLQDAGTGVHSRFAYEERLSQEHASWLDTGRPLAFLLLDIDYFNSINDTFGHQAGDRVLRLVAQLIETRTRKGDFFARVSGEEFAMLLPATEIDAARKLAEQIRNIVEQSGFNHKGNPVPVTVSCGVTGFRRGDTPEAVFERADQALHEAKLSGRNCTVVN